VIDREELKSRALLLLAVALAASLGCYWFRVVPSAVAEMQEKGPLVRQGEKVHWRNLFLAPFRRRSEPQIAQLPPVGGEFEAGIAGALIAVVVSIAVFAVFQKPAINLIALIGFFLGPYAFESAIRSMTGYPTGDGPGFWCWLGVAGGLISGPVLVAVPVYGFLRWIGSVAGE
jgi:hypothetical protein